ALAREPGAKGFGLGQRMPAVLAALRRGQVAVELREMRARDVRLAVLPLAELRLREVMAAVEDAPLAEVRGQLGSGDECLKCKACDATTRGSALRRLPSAIGKGPRRRAPAPRARGGRGRAARRFRCPRARSRRTPPAAPRRTRARNKRSLRDSRTR